VSHDETFDAICVLLEAHDQGGVHVEYTADLIMAALDQMGEDLLGHLDPPVGLKRWLDSHGLSLVTTREVSPPAVWDSLQGDEEEDAVQEGEPGESLPFLEVGGFVEYRTAPSGPHSQSNIGSGRIKRIDQDTIEVEFSPGGAGIILFPGVDLIRPVTRPALP